MSHFNTEQKRVALIGLYFEFLEFATEVIPTIIFPGEMGGKIVGLINELRESGADPSALLGTVEEYCQEMGITHDVIEKAFQPYIPDAVLRLTVLVFKMNQRDQIDALRAINPGVSEDASTIEHWSWDEKEVEDVWFQIETEILQFAPGINLCARWMCEYLVQKFKTEVDGEDVDDEIKELIPEAIQFFVKLLHESCTEYLPQRRAEFETRVVH